MEIFVNRLYCDVMHITTVSEHGNDVHVAIYICKSSHICFLKDWNFYQMGICQQGLIIAIIDILKEYMWHGTTKWANSRIYWYWDTGTFIQLKIK